MKHTAIKNGSRNALLTEITIVILFFALSSIVLLKLFANVYETAKSAEIQTQATVFVQELSEKMKASEDFKKTLSENGFSAGENTFLYEGEAFDVSAEINREMGQAGYIETCILVSTDGETELLNVKVAKYHPGEAAHE